MPPAPTDLQSLATKMRPFAAARCHLLQKYIASHKGSWRAQDVSERGFGMPSKLLAARRQSNLQASTSYSSSEELSLGATDYYRDLMTAARKGASGQAQQILSHMVSSGLDLTPRAYHGLIFSYMKAGDDSGALNALHAALDTSALKPLPESYAVVIFICAENSNFLAAETVYNMVQTGEERRPSWIAYLKGLVGAGLEEEDKETQLTIIENIEEILREGERQGWFPDLDLYEDIFGLMCEDDKKGLVAEEMLFEILEKREGAETRHYNCILRAQAIWMGVHNARKLLNDMIEGRTGGKRRVLPDINSYNALIEGCLIERMQGFSYAVKDLEGVVAEVVTVGIQMNKRTHTLILMFYLMEENVDRVLFELRETERLAARGRVLEYLSDRWMGSLVDFLLTQKCVLEVARLLYLLKEEHRSLPEEVSLVDRFGRSFHTRWLPFFMAGQHFERRNLDLEKYHETDTEEDQDAFLMENTYLNRKNVAIDENTGEEMSVSNMNASQMKAELEAKGLSTKGLKGDLSRRVQHSRGNQPIPVREMMRRRRLEIEAKLSRDDEKQSEREVLNSVRSTAKFTSSWSHMGEAINTVDYETSVFDPDTEEREENREHLAELEAMDLPQETKRLLKERRIAFNRADVETEFQLDAILFNTETPEFKALNPNFHGREGYGIRMTWPKFGKAARLALYMMELAEQLDGKSTIVDFIEILEACVEENDPDTAYALLAKLHEGLNTVDPDVASLFYNKVLLLCTGADRLDLASVVADMMITSGIEPTGPLGDPLVLPTLQDYGSGLAKLLRDIRRAGEGAEPDQDSRGEADRSEEDEEDLAVGADDAATEGDDHADSSSGDSSSDEFAGDAWEQGLEDEEEEMREEDGEAAEITIEPPADFDGYYYEFDDDSVDFVVENQEIAALVEEGVLVEEVNEDGEIEAGEGSQSDDELRETKDTQDEP